MLRLTFHWSWLHPWLATLLAMPIDPLRPQPNQAALFTSLRTSTATTIRLGKCVHWSGVMPCSENW